MVVDRRPRSVKEIALELGYRVPAAVLATFPSQGIRQRPQPLSILLQSSICFLLARRVSLALDSNPVPPNG
jgi:hypothetical protein